MNQIDIFSVGLSWYINVIDLHNSNIYPCGGRTLLGSGKMQMLCGKGCHISVILKILAKSWNSKSLGIMGEWQLKSRRLSFCLLC